MTLVVQVLGVLVLGALIGLLITARTKAKEGSPGHAIASGHTSEGMVAIALAVAGLAFWNGAWSMGRTFIEQAGTYPSVHTANLTPGSLFPADENLLNPAESAIPRHARVYLICYSGSVGCSGEWIGYQLSPRLFVEKMSEAQYVLVYGASPKKVPATAHLHTVLERADGGVVENRPAT